MKKSAVVFVFLCLATIAGCSKKAATSGQTATLALKDGTTVTGTVTKSNTSSITIQTPTGVVSTYPLSQVASVNYGPAPGAQPDIPQNAPPADQAPQQSASAPPPGPAYGSNAPAGGAPSYPPQAAYPPQQAAPPPQQSAPPPEANYAPAPTYQVIPAGTTLAIRTNQTIDSRTSSPGQTYTGVVAHDIVDANGQVAIPRGSEAMLVIRDARTKGRFEGRSELVLDVGAVRVQGHTYRLETSDFVERGRESVGANKRTAKFAGGVGLLGGIVGALAGGGRGAAIGALSGAAAGAGAETLTRGRNVRVPAETLLDFRLESAIRVRELQ